MPTFEPIGVVRSPFVERVEAPRQPAAAAGGVAGRIELAPGRGYEDALADLDRFSHLWVLFWFHRNDGWRPKVLPPRDDRKRGVFATRAPRRPNPIGLSVVRLERVAGLVLHVSGLDILDGTPVLDLKPYLPYADAVPDATSGWLAPEDPRPGWRVGFSAAAAEQLAWLAAEHGVALEDRLRSALAPGPMPHAYRRIRRRGDGYRIAVGPWRADFVVASPGHLEVTRLLSGYRPRELAADPALAAHRAFAARYP